MEQRWGNATDAGPKENHDCHGVFRFGDVVVAVVADGMGSNQGGAHASALAVRTIYDVLAEQLGTGASPRDALVDAIKRANTAIFDASRRNHRLAGMNTTVAAVAVASDLAHVAHVGDSRVYLIRGESAKAITRDHTMVNLFVEAELLSAEDAASHPEAHVLSRSLGVERTVEVEVQPPMTVEYADTFVLTTDGAHTLLAEGDFASLDWSDPGEGVAAAFRLLEARRLADNGTIIGMITGEFEGEPSPPTPPPILEDVADPLSAFEPEAPRITTGGPRAPAPVQAAAPVEAPSFMDIPKTPAPAPRRDAAPMDDGLIDIPAEPPKPAAKPPPSAPPPAPPMAAQPTLKPDPKSAQGAQQAPAAKDAKGGDKKAGAKSRLPLVLGGVAVVAGLALLGVIGAGVMLMKKSPAGTEEPVVGEPTAAVDPAPPTEAPEVAVAVVDPAAPTEVPPAETVPLPPVETNFPLFVPEALPEVRNPSHHAVKYLNPPPGGSDQFDAIRAAKEQKDCAKSLDLVVVAMSKSIDYASIYTHPWKCFNDMEQKPLLTARAEDPTSFERLLPHFVGAEPIDPNAPPVETKPKPTANAWAAPAIGGIEYRLEKFHASGDKDRFADVMLDKYGEKVVAEHLLRDLWVEATAARGLASMAAQDEETVQWWARRVYVTQRYWDGRIGDLIRKHRADAAPKIDEMLRVSVKGVDPRTLAGARPADSPLPEPVWKAYAAGLGEIPLPDATKAEAAPKPKPKAEDDLPMIPKDLPPPPPKQEKIRIH